MKIHILGICGTFMGGIAMLARELGHEVSGSDANVYPPMSIQLMEQGINLIEGYNPAQLDQRPDIVIIGNSLSRGNPCIEYILNTNIRYTSGPQWLNEHVLQDRHVLAVAGTHGKTTTASMLAWSLEVAGLKPGFLIGGIPINFDISARLGSPDYFVVEADEYDTAFFDKRSKFIHYRPKTLIINNIEFDHVDIFADLAAIRREFHHLVRILPDHGLIVARQGDPEINKVLEQGCWTPVEYFGTDNSRWQARSLRDDYSEFEILVDDQPGGILRWDLIGQYNACNALATAAAACHVGLTAGGVCEALAGFSGVKRRLERLDQVNDITVYDDFAHHPTEIRATLAGLRQHVGSSRIIAIMEPRSNTMRRGTHKSALAGSFKDADIVFLYQPEDISWDLMQSTASLGNRRRVFTDIDEIIAATVEIAEAGNHIIIMSNGGFGGIHHKLIERLMQKC